MGDVGGVIATPFVAVATVVTGQANKKIYYDCPRCHKEVWVYAAGAAFSGRKCINCRGKSGPIDLGIVGDAVDVAITPVTAFGAIITGNANEKIWYNCPKCGKRKWVSAMAPHLKGTICIACKPVLERSFLTIHPLGQAASINKIEKDTAKFKGTILYQQWGQSSDKNYSTNSSSLNDKISWYEARGVRIMHGAASWAFNAVVQTATLGQADYIDHTWVVIKTTNGNYYQLQFRGLGLFNDNGLIELRKCSSSYDCNQTGLAEADKEPDANVFEFDSGSYSYSFNNASYSIGDVINWMKSHQFSAKYNVMTHNCQDLCKAFYNKF